MASVAADDIFIDTNGLVYASVNSSPFYHVARTAITNLAAALTTLWVSRQVLHEYLATLARPRTSSISFH
jgi:predicted nucleic acid-binding protein